MRITLAICPQCGQETQEEVAALQLDDDFQFVRCGCGGVLVLEKEDLVALRDKLAKLEPQGRA